MKKIIIPIILLFMFIPFIVNAENLSVTDCDNNTLYTTVPSNLKGLAKIMAQNAYLDNGQSEYVTSCNGVSFSAISSDTNGKGIYEIASTKNDTYPIYYYRGAVNTNNVKFAGFCWKAIRTTDTGGVKLIYNGVPDQYGYCTNTTGTATQIGVGTYNSDSKSLIYVGYMHGTPYNGSILPSSSLNNEYVYGKDVTYSGRIYTLTNTITSTGRWSADYNTLNNNHYTCFSTGTTCSSVKYIYYTSTNATYAARYITISNGKNVSDALDEMLNESNVNTTKSLVKSRLDNWYNLKLSSYTNYIEDTIYCNDRSISELGGWDPNGGDTSKVMIFGSHNRIVTAHSPSLQCSRISDRFTVSSTLGNGALTYPVGLITSDELMYAGAKLGEENPTFYLYTNRDYWTLSPYYFSSHPFIFYASSNGGLYGTNVNNSADYRPVISLKSTDVVKSGDGTPNNPYFIKVNHKISIEANDKTENISFNVDDVSSVESDETITFRIKPIDNYALDSVRIIDKNNNEVSFNSTSNENEYSFTMPDSDVTIIPSYKKNRFKVNISIQNETEDIDINVENISSVIVGENVVFKVTPIKGYKINNIRIIDSNNNEISFNPTSNENEYSFTMPESDVTIIPSYEKVSNSVNVEDNKNNKEIIIEVNDSKAVVYEDVVIFKIIPEDGYEIQNIIITDKNNNKIKYEKTSNKNEYRFIMPDTDVLIKPIYRKIQVDNNIINPKTSHALTILLMLALLLIISHYIKKQKLQFN